jgi:hypothetical protein
LTARYFLDVFFWHFLKIDLETHFEEFFKIGCFHGAVNKFSKEIGAI